MKVEKNKEQVKGTDLVIGLRIANKHLCNEGEAKTNQVFLINWKIKNLQEYQLIEMRNIYFWGDGWNFISETYICTYVYYMH